MNVQLFITQWFDIWLDAQYELLKSGYQCKSEDTQLSKVYLGGRAQKCANKCKETDGCKYFILENDGHIYDNCKWEKTTDHTCPEGWKRDSKNDFYALIGKF